MKEDETTEIRFSRCFGVRLFFTSVLKCSTVSYLRERFIMSSLIQPELFFSALSPAEQRIQQALEDIRQGKPVLVMRDTTERPEALEAGTVKLVGTDKAQIVQNVAALLDDPAIYHGMAGAHNPYGDGTACQKIIDFLRQHAL